MNYHDALAFFEEYYRQMQLEMQPCSQLAADLEDYFGEPINVIIQTLA